MKIKITESQYRKIINEQESSKVFVVGIKFPDTQQYGKKHKTEFTLSNGENIYGSGNGYCMGTERLEYCGTECIRTNCVLEFKYKDNFYKIDHSSFKEIYDDKYNPDDIPYLKYFESV